MSAFSQPAGVRARQKVETAQRVLSAARDVFEEKGFEAASVRLIASRAGVSVGTVLHHYVDKRQLLYAALHDALEVGVAASIARAGRGSLLKRLMAIAEGVFAVYEARPALSRTLLKEGLFADGVWGARFIEQTAGVHAVVARLIREAVGRGELPTRFDVDAAGLAFLSFFNFALLSWTQGAPLPRGPMGLMERLLRAHLGLEQVTPRKRTVRRSR